MRILHYFLGFPPYRTGGLTKFAYDLMCTQAEDQNEVAALWPGKMALFGGKPSIKRRKSIQNIRNYELVNPLPVSLDEGIKDIASFTAACDMGIFIDFLSRIAPDVIHIHTLMGLYSEFIAAAKELKIKMIYTSHDYFGLCPKVTFYRYGECCDDDNHCQNCIPCNAAALSIGKIKIMQSPIYRYAKNSTVIKKLRKRHRTAFFNENHLPAMPEINLQEAADNYTDLRTFYLKMYQEIDRIHFNSTVAEQVFKKYMTPKDSIIISITHKEIRYHDNVFPQRSDPKIRILFLAPAKPYKGFHILRKVLDEIWNEGNHNFELCVFSSVQDPSPYMKVREDGYSYSELPQIFSEADVLAAPSVWYETFGFTVLEALSYGVPVIVTDHVGAKDLVHDFGMIVRASDADHLKNAIETVDKDWVLEHREKIKTSLQLKLWSEFIKEIYDLYSVQ